MLNPFPLPADLSGAPHTKYSSGGHVLCSFTQICLHSHPSNPTDSLSLKAICFHKGTVPLNPFWETPVGVHFRSPSPEKMFAPSPSTLEKFAHTLSLWLRHVLFQLTIITQCRKAQRKKNLNEFQIGAELNGCQYAPLSSRLVLKTHVEGRNTPARVFLGQARLQVESAEWSHVRVVVVVEDPTPHYWTSPPLADPLLLGLPHWLTPPYTLAYFFLERALWFSSPNQKLIGRLKRLETGRGSQTRIQVLWCSVFVKNKKKMSKRTQKKIQDTLAYAYLSGDIWKVENVFVRLPLSISFCKISVSLRQKWSCSHWWDNWLPSRKGCCFACRPISFKIFLGVRHLVFTTKWQQKGARSSWQVGQLISSFLVCSMKHWPWWMVSSLSFGHVIWFVGLLCLFVGQRYPPISLPILCVVMFVNTKLSTRCVDFQNWKDCSSQHKNTAFVVFLVSWDVGLDSSTGQNGLLEYFLAENQFLW